MMDRGIIALGDYPSLRRAAWPLSLLLLTFLVLIFYLIWTEKVPLRVWDSFLATISIFGLFILLWAKLDTDRSRSQPQERNVFAFIVPGLLCLATLFALNYAITTTKLNIARQAAYQN